ncbi:transposase [Roseiflexus sp.]
MPKRERRLYPTKYATDLTDAQWDAIAPLVTVTSPQGGRPTEIDLRVIVNALLDKHRTGCQWRLLRADVPPMSPVRSSFDTRNCNETCIKIN